MGQDRKPKEESMCLWSPRRRQEYIMEKKTFSLISGPGKTEQLHVKD